MKEDTSPFPGYNNKKGVFMDFLKKILEKFILEINDSEIIYVYHVNMMLNFSILDK